MKKYLFILFIAFGSGLVLKAQSLDDYFKIAAENNPGLQAKYKNFEAAMQRTSQVNSLPDPNISFGYFISYPETRVGPQRARISLSQMFPWFGTLKIREEASTYLAEAKFQEFLDAKNKLFYDLSAAYYPLSELNQLIAIEEENISILSTYKDIALERFQNDKGTMVDVLDIDLMLKKVQTNVSILNQKKKPLDARFNTLLNRGSNEPIEFPDSLSISNAIFEYPGDSMLSSNPQLEELNLKIQAYKANEQAALKQGLPKIGVGLDYIIVGQRNDMIIAENGKDVIMPTVAINVPIFRKKYNAAKSEARIMQESVALQKEQVTNDLVSAFEMAWFNLQKQSELIRLYEEQINVVKQSLSLLLTSFANSGIDFEEVLGMQQKILKYQKLKITALTAYAITLAELDYITAKEK